MTQLRLVQQFKKHLIIYSILLFVSIIILSVAGFIAYLFLRYTVLDKRDEEIIDKKFHAEVAAIPQIKVNRFFLWEGDSHADITIANKGSVFFWYGKDGVPRIEGIGSYPIPFVCYYVDTQGNKTNYAYNMPLVLDKKTTLYKKWFLFEVNNLNDLVSRYDDIIQALNTLPKNPEMVDFKDSWGKRSVVKNPNPNFILKPPPPSLSKGIMRFITSLFLQNGKKYGKNITCDLYVKTKQ